MPHLLRFVAFGSTALASLLSAPAGAAPKIDDSFECTAVGEQDVCELTLVTDKTKAAMDKRPDKKKVTVSFRAETTDQQFKTIGKLPWVTRVLLEKTSETITDLSPLASLKGLVAITVPSGVKSLAPLSGFTALEEVDLSGAHVEDISALKDAKQMRRLLLSRDSKDLAPLAPMTGLVELVIQTEPTSWKFLAGLSKLESLKVTWSKLKDTTGLSGLTSLRVLRLGMNDELADISGLKGLLSLEELDLSFTRVASLDAVAGMTKLRVLSAHSTKVSSLAPLAKLTKLENLQIGYTTVTDLSALKASTNTLKYLALPKTLPKSAAASLQSANPKLVVVTAS